jgi:hypothetical protein
MTEYRYPRPEWLPELDLRPVTRNSNREETRIYAIINAERFLWIRCGLISRFEIEAKGQWLGAYFDFGITDASEDSAYAFHIDVVGAQLSMIHNGVVEVRAWIAGGAEDRESFHVPTEEYDLSKFEWCPADECQGDERHQLTDYTPKPNLALWEKLRGVEIVVEMMPVIPEEEQ